MNYIFPITIASLLVSQLNSLDFKSLFQTTNKVKSLSNAKTVAITGASGLIGRALVPSLEKKGYKILKITTNRATKDKDALYWNPSLNKFEEASKLNGVEAIIHLAGENVAGKDLLDARWTPQRKDAILNSRVKGTKLIVDSVAKLSKKPKVFISASAVGYYGYQFSDSLFDETASEKGTGFLAEVCESWEKEAIRMKSFGARTVCTRFAPVFSKDGGILAKLLPIFLLGIGGVIGNGKQGFSWVSLRDVVNAIEFILDNSSINGVVNVCSPQPSDNEGFTQAMGKALSRLVLFPLPEFVVNVLFGEMGQEMLLGGQKVIPTKLQKAGFVFQDEDLVSAIKVSSK